MKFNCGLTKQEKQKRRIAKYVAFVKKIEVWHDWFAWFPVRVASGDCRWLETIERRVPVYWYSATEPTRNGPNQYRAKQNPNEEVK